MQTATTSLPIPSLMLDKYRSSVSNSKSRLKVVLSSGQGKLHFHETVAAVARAGVEVDFVVGWAPGKPQKFLVDFAGLLLGESGLSARMAARFVRADGVSVRSNTWPEFAGQVLHAACKIGMVRRDRAAALSFRLSGFAACGYLKSGEIFHVRSGAGQGGAIRTARKNGLKILADHSIAHPAFMKCALSEEYALARLKSELTPDSELWKLVLRDCDESDLLLVNSDFVKETFVQNGFSADRIRVAYLGVHERYFGLKSSYERRGPLNLLFTGNFSLRKGARILLEAVRKLRAGGIDARLRVIGNLANGRIWIKESDKVFLQHTPYIPPERLLPALQDADLFAFPTFSEGSSRSAMEAAAAGLPVVTTRCCGLPLVDGKSALYVPPGDVEVLAAAIARAASDETLRRLIGNNASALIRGLYTWPQYGQLLLAVYRGMLQ